jgi:hypothetical protein
MSQADSVHTTSLPETPERLDLDALSSARLHFTALADELPACPHRDALRLAADIADSLSNLRSDVTRTIVGIDEGRFTTMDAASELRLAKQRAAIVISSVESGGDNASRS